MAMDALGLPPGKTPVGTLSGGERRRVALCRLLLQAPDLLLLDEPTNHLDAQAVAWLERFLAQYPGTVVAVTHDRYFLDNVAGWILELDRGAGHTRGRATIRPGWSRSSAGWRSRPATRRSAGARWSASWSGSAWRRARGRRRARRGLGAYERLLGEDPGQRIETAEITIPPGPRLGDVVVEAAGLRKAWGRRPAHRRPVVHAAAGGHRRRHRPERRRQDHAAAAHRGRAGAGTPGTLRLGRHGAGGLRGPDARRARPGAGRSGRRSRAAATSSRWAAARWPRGPTCRGSTSGAPISSAPWARCRAARRNRVHLAKLLRGGANLLLLDEPTNDLDVDTLRALEDALVAFAGCAVVVSHDRWFLDRIATHILAFEADGRAVWFAGNHADYAADRRRRLGPGGRARRGAASSASSPGAEGRAAAFPPTNRQLPAGSRAGKTTRSSVARRCSTLANATSRLAAGWWPAVSRPARSSPRRGSPAARRLPGRRVDQDGGGAARDAERRHVVDLVSPAPQLAHDLGRDARLDVELVEAGGVRPERSVQVLRPHPRPGQRVVQVGGTRRARTRRC